MMQIDRNTLAADLAAFSDDETEVEIAQNGEFIFTRTGSVVACRLVEDTEGYTRVEVDGQVMSYKRFISHYLGRLDVLAERILLRRPAIGSFVNGPVILETFASKMDGRAVELMKKECEEPLTFATRVVFLTADAGHGKTILLREYQTRTAEAFKRNLCPYLFWHVDLQGRQLLRLSEALMGDLGELRVPGLWMSSIMRLLRHRVLILAIDGFDELAAEQGSTDALGALALLVKELEGHGVIVAASRKTFFDTEDYVKRSSILHRQGASDCQFDQIHLRDWTEQDATSYLSKISVEGQTFNNPNETYLSILNDLSADDHHPMLTRPFLLDKIAKIMLRFSISSTDVIGGMQNPMQGVASVIEAFIKREVDEKWRFRQTGEPYLSYDQHIQFLSDVAEEMWMSQKERLPLDVVELIATVHLEEWKIEEDKKRQVIDMAKMHALLVVPVQGGKDIHSQEYRSFDHQEFRNYFIAVGLASKLEKALTENDPDRLHRFLSLGQLPDGVARYASGIMQNRSLSQSAIVAMLIDLVQNELRPTYLRENIGTLLPSLLNQYATDEHIIIDAPLVYPSVVFERTILRNIEFRHSTFTNTSFLWVDWKSVTFADCEFTDITVDEQARYEHVHLQNCRIGSVRVNNGADELRREYSPIRMTEALSEVGIVILDQETLPQVTEGPRKALARRLLNIFRRTTNVSQDILKLKFGEDYSMLTSSVIPLLEKHGVIRSVPWRGGGQAQDMWTLTTTLESVLRAEGAQFDVRFSILWRDLNAG